VCRLLLSERKRSDSSYFFPQTCILSADQGIGDLAGLEAVDSAGTGLFSQTAQEVDPVLQFVPVSSLLIKSQVEIQEIIQIDFGYNK